MQRSGWNYALTAALVAFLATAAAAVASTDVSVGDTGSGYETLGPLSQQGDGLTIETPPEGATMDLFQWITAKELDHITIDATEDWKLEVSDDNTDPQTAGKMRKGYYGEEEPPLWHYYADQQAVDLIANFNILVEKTYSNDEVEEITYLDDALDLSSGSVIIAEGTTKSNGLAIGLMYSQVVSQGDGLGFYRIDLTYTLSPNT